MPELSQTTGPSAAVRLRSFALAPALITGTYLAVQAFLFSVHEPWRDEAQAWLKVDDLTTLWDFLIVPAEGHPPLWFWLIKLLSSVLTFDQARMLMLPVVAVNAWLLARLFGERPTVLIALLLSLALLHSWGFHFRPYALILTCVAGALLLDRDGRPIAATWVLALSCGLSFFSGWLFGLWLLVLLHRGVPPGRVVAPVALAVAFGLSAVLSSLGNPDGGTDLTHFWVSLLNGLAFPFAVPDVPPILIVIAAWALIAYGLRRTPYLATCVLVLLLLLSLFGSLVYGLAEWHAAFGMMLVVMAFALSKAPAWPLVLLLLTQDFWGIRRAAYDVSTAVAADGIAYAVILDDAGNRLDPPRNLVSWPDYLLTPSAARHDFRFISGNNGAIVGAVDWRTRKHLDIDPEIWKSLPTPYWLVCAECSFLLRQVDLAGRTATQLLLPTDTMYDPVAVYRID